MTEHKKEYQKQYYQKNKARLSAYAKEWTKKNWEKVRERNRVNGRKWYQKNKERHAETGRIWSMNPENKKKKVKYVQKYVKANREKVREYNNKFTKSLEGRYRLLKFRHKERWSTLVITIEEFKNLVSKFCIYCGESEKRIGIDRIDNSIGYTKENSAPCCALCNFMKKAMSKNEFLSHIKKIYEFKIKN